MQTTSQQQRRRKTVRVTFAIAFALLVAGCQTPSLTGSEAPVRQPINPARFCATAEPITDAQSDQITEHNAIYETLCRR